MEKWKTKSRFPTFPPPPIPLLPEANPGPGRASTSARWRALRAALRGQEELGLIGRIIDAAQPTVSAKKRDISIEVRKGTFLCDSDSRIAYQGRKIPQVGLDRPNTLP